MDVIKEYQECTCSEINEKIMRENYVLNIKINGVVGVEYEVLGY